MFDSLSQLFSLQTHVRRSRSTVFWGGLLLLSSLILLSGCARTQTMIDSWRGPGFTDNKESEYVAGMRDQDDEEPMNYGTMTTKGREIERSLGQ